MRKNIKYFLIILSLSILLLCFVACSGPIVDSGDNNQQQYDTTFTISVDGISNVSANVDIDNKNIVFNVDKNVEHISTNNIVVSQGEILFYETNNADDKVSELFINKTYLALYVFKDENFNVKQEFTIEFFITEPTIEQHKHDYDSWVIDSEPSEHYEGRLSRKCTFPGCGEYEYFTLPKLSEVDYIVSIHKETSSTPYRKSYTFLQGDIRLVFYTDLYCDNHEYKEWKIVEEPTFEKNGIIEHECGLCGHIERLTLPTLDDLSYSKQTLISSTCTTDGLDQYTYQFLDVSFDVIVPAIGNHNFSEWYTVISPTLESEGTLRRNCTNCNLIEEKTIPALNNTDYNVDITEPTCHQVGWASYTLIEYPDNTYVIELPFRETQLIHHERVEATCSNNGNIEYWECPICHAKYKDANKENYIYNDNDIILSPTDFSPHNFGLYELIEIPSEYQSGKLTRKCQWCNLEESFYLPCFAYGMNDYQVTTKTKGTVFDPGINHYKYIVEETGQIIEFDAYGETLTTFDDGIFEYSFKQFSQDLEIKYIGNTKDLTIPKSYKGKETYSKEDGIEKEVPITSFDINTPSTFETLTINNEIIHIYKPQDINVTNTISLPAPLLNYKLSAPNIIINSGKYIEDDAFYDNEIINNVIIEEGLEEIGLRAFDGCANLSSIHLPKSLKMVGAEAFAGKLKNDTNYPSENKQNTCNVYIDNLSDFLNITFCSESSNPLFNNGILYINNVAVTDIIIPNEQKLIKNYAFPNIQNIDKLQIASDVVFESFALDDFSCRNLVAPASILDTQIDKTKLETIEINGGTYIKDHAFDNIDSLTSVNIHDSITSIGYEAFHNCINLSTISFNNIATIEKSAFGYCRSLQELYIPISMQIIGEYAFYGCDNMSIVCEAPFKPAGWHNDWNPAKRSVQWGVNNVMSNNEYDYVIRNNKIYLSKYKGTSSDITVPDTINELNVVDIGSIFADNQNIINITLPKHLEKISSYAFYNCRKLEQVILSPYIQEIGDFAFYNCEQLLDITIPMGVKRIGVCAFYNCSKLITVIIPDGVTCIDKEAFKLCIYLETIDIPSSVTFLGSDAFSRCPYLIIFTDKTDDDPLFTALDYYRKPIVWNYGGVNGQCNDGIIWASLKDGTATIATSRFKNITSLTIPDMINGYVTKSICAYAFMDFNKLETVKIEGNLESIGRDSFDHCIRLQSVYIDDLHKWLNIDFAINSNPLRHANDLYLNNKLLKNIVIPNDITYIKPYAFEGCSMNTITVPNSVTKIGSKAFSGCYNLTIYCEASAKQPDWDNTWNYGLCPVVWNYEDKITHTYKFGTFQDFRLDDIIAKGVITLPTNFSSCNDTYFDGWYTNREFTGEKITEYYWSPTDVVLYAKWVPSSEYKHNNGNSLDRAIPINNKSVDVAINRCGQYKYLSYSMLSWDYKMSIDFYSNSQVKLFIYNETDRVITEYSNTGHIDTTFLALKSYFIILSYTDNTITGNINVTIS